MALSKTFTNKKGISVSYLKVVSVTVDFIFNKVIVGIRAYVSDDIRNAEKEFEKAEEIRTNMYKELDELMLMERTEEINEKIIELSNSINELTVQDEIDMKDLYLEVITEKLEYVPDIDLTLSGVYNELKKLEKYKNSEDV